MSQRRVAVIGAGLAGLAAAYELTRHPDVAVTVFEASSRAGGSIETVHRDGFTIECGPDSWVSERPEALHLVHELGLGGHIMYSNEDRRRTWLARGCTLTPLPEGMRLMVPTRWEPVMSSPLFSWSARLAYLREPRMAAQLRVAALERPADFDESVYDFVVRHFGVEAAETIAGPLLGGIFGGDAHELSAAATMAPFVRLEREHGSLIAPIMARAQAERAGNNLQPLFTTLREGLGLLVDRLIASLPADTIRFRAPVRDLHRHGTGWRVACEAEAPTFFDKLLISTPSQATGMLLAGVVPEAAALLPQNSSSAVLVALCFDAAASAGMRIPRGFGFLAADREPCPSLPQLLAGTFMHHKFDHRVPEGGVLLRGFFGGAAAQALMQWPEDALVAAAAAHFSRLLGHLPQHTHAVVRRWPRSLPQYTIGHVSRIRALGSRIRAVPGLALAGNAYEGVGLSALIRQARQAARSLLEPAI